MEFALLGPVEVRRDGQAVALGGPKQRAILAILLLNANRPVSRGGLIEGLWGDRPPASAAESLDSYLSRLRRALGPGRLSRGPAGYVLAVEPEELDLDRFERLLSNARVAVDATQRARLLKDALALWRGSALADLHLEPFARDEIARLEERRLVATEQRIEAELEAGASSDLVPELERLVHDNPLRERAVAQLATALYRGARQSEALAVLRSTRRRLADELGLEPGPELRDVERRILQHDPGLRSTPRIAQVRPQTRRRVIAALVGLGVVSVIVTVVLVLLHSASTMQRLDPAANRLVSIGLGSGRVQKESALADAPVSLTAAFGSLWAADPNGEQLLRIDENTGMVTDRIAIGGQPSAVAAGGGGVWVASAVGGLVTRVDPTTDRRTDTVRLGGANPAAIVFDHGSVWVGDSTDRSLVRIDPETGSIRQSISLDIAPTALAADGDEIWAAGFDSAAMEEIDLPSAQVLADIPVGQGPAAVAVSRGSVWVVNSLDGTLTRISTATDRTLATTAVGSGPAAITTADGTLWIANEYSGTVAEIDSRRDVVKRTLPTGGQPTTITAAGGQLWVGAGPDSAVHRGGTLTLAETATLPTIDPAFEYFAEPTQLSRLAYDTLVTFDNAPGAFGLRLVPDLALQLPKPANNGLTYTFRIRPGIRYSSGRLLLASDFRRAIERIFKADSPGRSFYTSIQGGDACLKHPKNCDLSRGIVTNDTAGTVIFHLAQPDPDFLFELTEFTFSAPVPPGTPNRDMRLRPIPGTGPYRVVAAGHASVRLERNPYFREWSHAAQPNGNPDTIRWVFPPSHQAEIREIEQGKADWTLDFIPVPQLHQIERTQPGLLHVNPAYIVEFVPLNTNLPPFDSLKVRRALNYAVDRRKIARLYGGALVATPLCQPLAPGLPGYIRDCPYTVLPDASGTYNGPDMARALKLVNASGRKGAHITVWGTRDVAGVPPAVPRYIASVLRRLGFRVTLRIGRLANITPAERRHFQISVDGDWLPDFPSPASYLPSFFGCRGANTHGYYCNHRLDGLMAEATVDDATDPAAAARLWADADRLIVNQAYWLPTVNIREVDLVSPRLANYEYNPVWGFLADQAWLR